MALRYYVLNYGVYLSVFGRNRQMGYRHIPDSRSDQQPAADGHSVHRVSGNNNNNNNNNSNASKCGTAMLL